MASLLLVTVLVLLAMPKIDLILYDQPLSWYQTTEPRTDPITINSHTVRFGATRTDDDTITPELVTEYKKAVGRFAVLVTSVGAEEPSTDKETKSETKRNSEVAEIGESLQNSSSYLQLRECGDGRWMCFQEDQLSVQIAGRQAAF